MIGKRLAHYEILEKVGSGGMGEVYRARDTKLGRDVALKILPAEMAGDPERLARFRREARAVAALNHPHIVTLHSVEEADGVHFLTMELVDGQPLDRLIPEDGLPLERILTTASALADALAAAHDKGIVHRDLKPANVMVTTDGRVKVLDFGLVKEVPVTHTADATRTSGDTQAGAVMGTPAYMSPEQLAGRPVDHRTDIFSLGILLYEMASGKRPFEGASPVELASSILRDAPPPVHERKRSLPPQLDRIVRRCLEKSPERRYETARGLGSDLATLRMESSGAMAVPHAGATRRAPWLWAGGLVLALLLGGAWYLTRGGRGAGASGASGSGASGASMIVVFPFENMGSADDQYFAAGIAEEITSRLSALNGLGVLSRTSATQYDRKGKTMQQIAADLGVDYVLDGTVRWARKSDGTSQVRITPQLIRASEDRQVWSASYDRSMDEIFRIQSEIASEVVSNLGMAVGGKEREALTAAPTTNVEAYHAFLRAHEILESITFSRADFDRAVSLLDDACSKDPGFLRAHAQLAQAHAGYIHFAWDPSEARLAKAKAAADRALAIDAGSPWSQLALGYYLYQGKKDYEPAYAAFSKAQEGLPSSSEAIQAMALVRRRQGKFEEAASRMQKAGELDPRNALVFFTLAETLTILRRYDEAERNVDRAIGLAPDAATGYTLKSRIALLGGDVAGARALLMRAGEAASASSENRMIRFNTAIGCRDYDLARRLADELPETANAQFAFECRAAARGWALQLKGDAKGARDEFARALSQLHAYASVHRDESNIRSLLGMVLAQLGRPDEALVETKAALTMRPASTDAWLRQSRLYDLATVEILTGRHDAAVLHLRELLEQPSDQVSVAFLRQSPLFDPLRKHPEFMALLR